MSSTCSSPASQQSSYSGYSSSYYPLTPQTAITSPSSSVGSRSPKVKSSRTHSQPSLKQHHLSPQTPTAFDGFDLSPNMAPTSSPSPSSTSQFDSASSPGMSAAPFTTFGSYPEYPEFPSLSARAPEALDQPSYPSSGYPPVWSFYGPSPATSSSYSDSQFPASPTFSEKYQPDSPAVDPFEYQLEDWYTADGQKVEFSAMALHCATM